VLTVSGGVSAPPIDWCSFLGNGLGGARLATASSFPAWPAEIRVTSCLFVGDSLQVAALEAGGVGDTFVRNVTMVGGNVKLMHGALDVTSCILRSPTPITDLSDTGSPTVTYSDLPGVWLPGTGNIDADPQFADPDAGDYTLKPGSPCINSGNPVFTDPDFSPSEMGLFTYDPWTNLGGGIETVPWLAGVGGLIAGKGVEFKMQPAFSGAVWLFASLHELGLPFKGGILWPAPDVVLGPLLPISFPHDHILAGIWPAGLPPGFSFVVQAWWPDAAQVGGWASSNGLRGVQP
jgi:hypothetical protein